tara:strand:+ start:2732 stop:3793 length:1062 start_codon:yes stop_codon:yes gene_type:complete
MDKDKKRNLNDILKDLDVSQEVIDYAKPPKVPKKFTSVRQNTFPMEDHSFMADLLFLPTTSEGYRYLLVVVDLWSKEFDIEPLKNKQPQTVLDAFKSMIQRPHLNFPKASIQTDQGSEFKGIFHNYMFGKNIYHKFTNVGRKTQMSTVESLNRTLGYLLNRYMASEEQKSGYEFKEWVKALPIIRKELNAIRKLPNGDPFKRRKIVVPIKDSKFKKGDIVHWALDAPETFTERKLNDGRFREGDRRWSRSAVKVDQVLSYNSDVIPYRYLINNNSYASYTADQLRLAKNQKIERFAVRDIIDARGRGKTREYLVWWSDFPKDQSTWEPKDQLIKDGLEAYIDRLDKRRKAKKK